MALSFTPLTPEEKKSALRSSLLGTSSYQKVIRDFAKTGEEIAVLTGYTATDAAKVYGSLAACSNKELKDSGVRIRKRREKIYLVNTKINPVADPPEKR